MEFKRSRLHSRLAGLYGVDGTNEEPVSVVDDYWRKDKLILVSLISFIKTDTNTRTVRFFYRNSPNLLNVRCVIALPPRSVEEGGEIVSAGTNTTEGGAEEHLWRSSWTHERTCRLQR